MLKAEMGRRDRVGEVRGKIPRFDVKGIRRQGADTVEGQPAKARKEGEGREERERAKRTKERQPQGRKKKRGKKRRRRERKRKEERMRGKEEGAAEGPDRE